MQRQLSERGVSQRTIGHLKSDQCAGQLFGPERYLATLCCYFSNAWLDTIVPIPVDERLNPGIIVTIKDDFLSTSDDQTINFHDLLAVDLARMAAEIYESEIGTAFVELTVGNNSYRKVRRERNNFVQRVRIIALLDSHRKITSEKWAIVKVILQNVPFKIP